jgi:signal peptidase I
MTDFGPVVVPAGEFFVMGDNRDVSLDSRSQGYGFVTSASIVGKPLYVVRSDRSGQTIN